VPVDHLVGCGLIDAADGQWSLRASAAEIERAVPESLRRTIERQMERLQSATWPLLEAASVVGADFTTRAVAAALGVRRPEHRERRRRARSLVERGAGPGSPSTGRTVPRPRASASCHTLYRDVIYDGLTSAHRRDLHRRIAQVIATGWAAHPAEVAAVLAMHFERAADHAQAAKYRRLAGDAAARRHAYEESIDHYRTALGLLAARPPGRERDGEELELLGRARSVVDEYEGVRRSRRRSHLQAGARTLRPASASRRNSSR
jgi:predicted ATPase